MTNIENNNKSKNDILLHFKVWLKRSLKIVQDVKIKKDRQYNFTEQTQQTSNIHDNGNHDKINRKDSIVE